MSMPLHRGALDNLRCGHPHADGGSCDASAPLYLHAECHPREGTWARYDGDGILTIVCGRCEKRVCRVQVAEPPRPIPFL